MSESLQQFGGSWTNQKLQRLQEYLIAYHSALKNQPFKLDYVDAFAGTGYNVLKTNPVNQSPLFHDLAAPEARNFLDGSARIALQIPRPFDRYVFVERQPERFAELSRLKGDFPLLASRIHLVNEEANDYLTRVCRGCDWISENRRAVVFLDPFGMQVTWTTICAIAETRAIDLWLLFPLGIGVMRLLPNDGQIPPGWRKRLDVMFGEPDWFSAFYRKQETQNLFGETSEIAVKAADYLAISRYFVKRLKTVFPHVAKNPLPLLNSSNCPLYLLCFAAAKPRRRRNGWPRCGPRRKPACTSMAPRAGGGCSRPSRSRNEHQQRAVIVRLLNPLWRRNAIQIVARADEEVFVRQRQRSVGVIVGQFVDGQDFRCGPRHWGQK